MNISLSKVVGSAFENLISLCGCAEIQDYAPNIRYFRGYIVLASEGDQWTSHEPVLLALIPNTDGNIEVLFQSVRHPVASRFKK